jgi:hypothetical protein
MIGPAVDLELARHQWAEGRRALERARADDPEGFRRLTAGVEVLLAELTRRVGQTFTLAELAETYDHADRWTLEVIDDVCGSSVPASVASAAAFDLYARRASDYVP